MAVSAFASIPAWFGFVSIPGKPRAGASPEPVRFIVLLPGDGLALRAVTRQISARGEEGAPGTKNTDG